VRKYRELEVDLGRCCAVRSAAGPRRTTVVLVVLVVVLVVVVARCCRCCCLLLAVVEGEGRSLLPPSRPRACLFLGCEHLLWLLF
jgi:hypothetical protein